MRKIIMCLALATTFTLSLNPLLAFAQDAEVQKAVLITGASTGIGRFTAEQLAAEGYFVYAGARKAKDIEELNKIDNIMAVRLDVTVQEEIDAAVKLIESEGRIVNISSIAGVLSGGLHGYGMYMMSKHAIEAFTDQLSFEMAELGVKVSAIEPGNFRSDIGMSRCKRMVAKSAEKKYEYYADFMQDYLNSCKEYVAKNTVSDGASPKPVADAIQHALFDEKPKEHYLVVPEQFEAMITIGKAMEELLNLNHEQEHSYTREQLIAMMDEEWAILRGEKTRDWGRGD